MLAVPLTSRIQERVVFSPRDHRTLLDKLATLFLSVAPVTGGPLLLVADAYYASRKVILPVLRQDHHLLSRVRFNTTAYRPAARPRKRRGGRPRLYGAKIQLRALFRNWHLFTHAPRPRLRRDPALDRLPIARSSLATRGTTGTLRPRHPPPRGRVILMTADRTLDPLTIIALYGYRFQIEVGVKQPLHTLGAYAYHFWMQTMTPSADRPGSSTSTAAVTPTATPSAENSPPTTATCNSAASPRDSCSTSPSAFTPTSGLAFEDGSAP